MFDVGSIIINRNIVFEAQNKLDHAYKRGRPCLVIAINDEYYYYLSLKGSKKKYEMNNLPLDSLVKPSYPSFENIFKAKICYKPEEGRLPAKDMLKVYKTFIQYYKTHKKCKYYDEVIEYITDYIQKNENRIY